MKSKILRDSMDQEKQITLRLMVSLENCKDISEWLEQFRKKFKAYIKEDSHYRTSNSTLMKHRRYRQLKILRYVPLYKTIKIGELYKKIEAYDRGYKTFTRDLMVLSLSGYIELNTQRGGVNGCTTYIKRLI